MNAFVTGGSRGIGRGIVLKYVKEGWGCALTYVGNQAGADETIQLAQKIRPDAKVKAYRLDVKDSAQVDEIVNQAIDDFGNIRAVINNAAVVRNNAVAMMTDDEWNEVIATDLSGPFFMARSFLMHFISNRDGRIINISSLAQSGISGQANYASAKAGLIGLTQSLAKEYGSKGVTSNAVMVGYVPTEMTDKNLAGYLHEYWMQYCPLKRVGTVEDIANAVFFLSSDEGSFINGETIRVSGGLTYAP